MNKYFSIKWISFTGMNSVEGFFGKFKEINAAKAALKREENEFLNLSKTKKFAETIYQLVSVAVDSYGNKEIQIL